MTLLVFQYPVLCLWALGCGALAALGAKKGTSRWFWLCCVSLTALVIAALACMIPYAEVVLLLLPAAYAVFFGNREEKP